MSKRNKLAELRALRASGKTTFDAFHVTDAPDLFEEVDDDGYKEIVRNRLDQDDFVVDDHGEGYVDDGREDWDDDGEADSDVDTAPRASRLVSRKLAKKSQTDTSTNHRGESSHRDDQAKENRDITDFFAKNAVRSQPKAKIPKSREEEDFLSDLLGEVGVPAPGPSTGKKTPGPVYRTKKRERSPSRRISRTLDTTLGPVKRARFRHMDDHDDDDDEADPLSHERFSHRYEEQDIPSSPPAIVPPDLQPPRQRPTSRRPDDPSDLVYDVDDDYPKHAPSSPTIRAVERLSHIRIKQEDSNSTSLSNIPKDKTKDKDQDRAKAKAQGDMDLDDDDLLEVARPATTNLRLNNVTALRPPQGLPAVKMEASSSPIKAALSQVTPPDDEAKAKAKAMNQLSAQLNVVSDLPDSPLDTTTTATPTRTVGKIALEDAAVEGDGSLLFYWLDYLEVNGSLCLFGKVRNRKTGGYVSCFVKVDNIMRKLYFLPKERETPDADKIDEKDADKIDQDGGEKDADSPESKSSKPATHVEQAVDMGRVFEEVDGVMTQMQVGLFKAKPTVRKYAFELPGIPREAQYLKLLYPYTKPELPADRLSGQTYAHVFGTNTALFEQFVLWKHIMGPCWLRIAEPNATALKNASYCKLEVLVEQPNTISVWTPDLDTRDVKTDVKADVKAPQSVEEAPPLTLMSLAIQTHYHRATNQREITAISARIYENVSLSDTTPAERLPCRTFTVCRPWTPESSSSNQEEPSRAKAPAKASTFPMGFETMAKKRSRGLIRPCRHEQELFNFLLAQIEVADPDVIMGHQLEGADYSVLLQRLQEKKIHGWSRIGRLRRSAWPSSLRGSLGGSVFGERQVMAGRLLCDLSNDAGKSIMNKCQSWSLTEMCSLYLAGGSGSGKNRRFEWNAEAALASAESMMEFITHLELDTHYIAALTLNIQMLPLTQVLTNLAGNSWARTLTGTRAERNEYILLHEFHRNKYICPDKATPTKNNNHKKRGNEQPDVHAVESKKKKKEKYKGGLVFEPEKGLYDKYVLVMDFNSLYPSIIQEYNICFTTVARNRTGHHPAAVDDEEDPARAEDVDPSEGGGLLDGGGGGGDEEDVPEVPVDQEQGILPRLIATLVRRRRQVKHLMKDKKATAEELATWDIKQLALKLTANSMYGCLGYTRSRFYARPLAILTTYKGREILRSTKELAESNALEVIYGDTDSVMIHANVDSVEAAVRVGVEFRRAVNERYRLLEIDIDNIFRRILLQAKKKYAAISLVESGSGGGEYTEKMEVKGLDMRRREYCALSKEVSGRVLKEILSGEETEVSVLRIHEYLRQIAEQMRAHTIPLAKYTIFTQLGKAPHEYPNADTMPQVQVALRAIARGASVRRGDVISYIMTTTDTENTGNDSENTKDTEKTTTTSASKAYAPTDVAQKESGLVPDVDWYLGKQIFPPIERLCAHISGTSSAQIAEQLGLDLRRYTTTASGPSYSLRPDGEREEVHPLASQLSDEERFQDCQRLHLRCRRCRETRAWEGVVAGVDRVRPQGLACGACGEVYPMLSVVAQVERAVRHAQTVYYEGWLVCSEPQCGLRTRQMSVYGTRCLGPRGCARDCLGKMRYEMSESQLYTQLLYWGSLWDVDRAKQRAAAAEIVAATADVVTGRDAPVPGGDIKCEGEGEATGLVQSTRMTRDQRDRILAMAEHNRVRFTTVKGAVDRYLEKCGRQWVAMDVLFAKLGLTPSEPRA